jgi:hypothetical protein
LEFYSFNKSGGITLKKFREPDQYSYQVEMIDGVEHFTVSFIDGSGNNHDVSISRKVFESLQELKIEENRQAYLTELYVSHFISDENDDEVSSMAFYPLPTTEGDITKDEDVCAVSDILESLTDTQRRRLLLNCVDGLSLHEIARQEGCAFFAVYKSVTYAKAQFEKNIKKFFE